MHVDINIEFKINNETITCINLYGFFLSLTLSIFLLNFVDITMIGLTLFVMGVFEVYRWLNKEGNRRIFHYCCNRYWKRVIVSQWSRMHFKITCNNWIYNNRNYNGERYFNCCYNPVLIWALKWILNHGWNDNFNC